MPAATEETPGRIQGVSWNPDVTFNVMVHRRLQRRLKGTYRKDEFWKKVARRTIYVLVALTTVGAVAQIENSDAGQAAAVLLGIVAVVVVRWLINTITLIMIWFYLAWMVMFIDSGDFFGMFLSNDELTERQQQTRKIVLYTATALSIATVVGHVFRHSWYPRAVRDHKLGASWFGLRAATDGGQNEIAYLSRPRRLLRLIPMHVLRLLKMRESGLWRRVAYVGGLDPEGRPHGAGQWSEAGSYGENLEGWWHHGRPTAPFRSLESHTGYAFHAMRIAVASNRQEAEGFDGMAFWPKHRSEGIAYTMFSVECSVSGMFFRHLPMINAVVYPPRGVKVNGALWCVWTLTSPIDAIVRRKHYPLGGIAFCAGDAGKDVLSSTGMAGGICVGPARAARDRGAAQINSKEASKSDDAPNGDGDDNINGDSGDAVHKTLSEDIGPPAGDDGNGGGADDGSGGGRGMFGGGAGLYGTDAALHAGLREITEINVANIRAAQLSRVRAAHIMPVQAEALIFVHGFSTSTALGTKAFAQLLTLGDFPPHLLPFVFSWPGGQIVTYTAARDIAQSERTQQDFARLIKDISDAGIEKVSIITHSMGVRVLCAACGLFEGTVRRLEDETPQEAAGSPRDSDATIEYMGSAPRTGAAAERLTLQLRTVTMLNPDFEEVKFTRPGGTYDILRRYCKVITVYADAHDGALLAGSLMNWSASLGRAIHGLKRPDLKAEPAAPPESLLQDNDTWEAEAKPSDTDPDGDAVSRLEAGKLRTSVVPTSIQQRAPQGGSIVSGSTTGSGVRSSTAQLRHVNVALMARAAMGGLRSTSRVDLIAKKGTGEMDVLEPDGGYVTSITGAHGNECGGGLEYDEEEEEEDGSWLDLDVIDTTWLENNVHDIRHSFFNLNPTIVDDLRELVVHHRRAELRSQVSHKFTNVHTFMVAPNFVKNP
eukprot:TRINITY_DN7330_c0_g1_i1.p1 TRINITY_DN7330_c0_g1~~TRINITY_DN7330_c0_g1_i1.p1  ORF type:complete len:937 (+),score=292.97 TRINITY_DN7330_c0_g1_i1:236-3046(+)